MGLKVQFLIASKDNDESLKKCLDSLLINLPLSDRTYQFGVLIVRQYLNKVTKKTFFQLINDEKYKFLKITYIIMKKDSGYIHNLNTGIKALIERRAPPKYIAFLHDDVIINHDWFQKMILTIENDQTISVITSLSNNKLDKRLLEDYYKSFGIIHSQLQREKLLKDALLRAEPIQLQKNLYQIASLYSTAIRLNIFKKYGLFDENLITSYNFQYEYFKKLIQNNQKIVLTANIVQHQCKSIYNQKLNKFNSDRSKLNIQLKNKFNQSKKKYVCYTYLTSDKLFKLQNIFKKYNDDNIDLICFSDINTNIDKWNVIDVSLLNNFQNQEIFKQFLKLHPHLFFEHYQKSAWINFDTFNTIPNLNLIFDKMTSNYVVLNDQNNYKNSWDLLYQSRWDQKISDEQFQKILSLYQIYHFPTDTYFLNSDFLVRNHNELICINTMNKIWKYYNSFIQNDKFLFNLCLWVNKENYDSIDFEKFVFMIKNLLEKSL